MHDLPRPASSAVFRSPGLRIAAVFALLCLVACVAKPQNSAATQHVCFDPGLLETNVTIENLRPTSEALTDVRIEGDAWFAFEIATNNLPPSISAGGRLELPVRANRSSFEENAPGKDPSLAGPPIGRGGALAHRSGDAKLSFRLGDKPGSVGLHFRPREQADAALEGAALALTFIALTGAALMLLLATVAFAGSEASKSQSVTQRLRVLVVTAGAQLSSPLLFTGTMLVVATVPLGLLPASAASPNEVDPLHLASLCHGASGHREIVLLGGEWSAAATVVGLALLTAHSIASGRRSSIAAHCTMAGAFSITLAQRALPSGLDTSGNRVSWLAEAPSLTGNQLAPMAVSAAGRLITSPVLLAGIAFLVAMISLHGAAPTATSQVGRDRVKALAGRGLNLHSASGGTNSTNSATLFALALLWTFTFPRAPLSSLTWTPGPLGVAAAGAAVICVYLLSMRLAVAAVALRRGTLEAWSLAAVTLALAMRAAMIDS